MKKLILNKLNLHSSEVLTREQLKNVLGGTAPQTTGMCYLVTDVDTGNSSCWFATSGNSKTLCNRVYPNSDFCVTEPNNYTGECTTGCTM